MSTSAASPQEEAYDVQLSRLSYIKELIEELRQAIQQVKNRWMWSRVSPEEKEKLIVLLTKLTEIYRNSMSLALCHNFYVTTSCSGEECKNEECTKGISLLPDCLRLPDSELQSLSLLMMQQLSTAGLSRVLQTNLTS